MNGVYILIQLVTQNKGSWLAISLGFLVFSAHPDVSVDHDRWNAPGGRDEGVEVDVVVIHKLLILSPEPVHDAECPDGGGATDGFGEMNVDGGSGGGLKPAKLPGAGNVEFLGEN